KKEFAKPKSMITSTVLLLTMAGFTFLMGIYFMCIDLLRPGMPEAVVLELKMVGYHCFALGFGFLCYLKLVFDKYKLYLSRPEEDRGGDKET
ncbi:MAG: hypothetical protein PHX05_00205, partial [Acidobacteriota bacterium]|nr:hypothetical protein [Acidobacteriota bacterium]